MAQQSMSQMKVNYLMLASNDKIFVTNCIFETNEFAISSNVKDIQITNNTFKFVGVADSHRYIILSGLLGNCYVNDNIFEVIP